MTSSIAGAALLAALFAAPRHAMTAPVPNPDGDHLVSAVERHDLNEVKTLLRRGAPLSHRDTQGRTPLVIAAAYQAAPRNADDAPSPDAAIFVELLRAAASRAPGGWDDESATASSEIVGHSFMALLQSTFGLQVFGRSGGRLLSIESEILEGPFVKDVDGDGRRELIVSVLAGKGTGVFFSERQIYFFDGVHFAAPLTVTDDGYEAFGEVLRERDASFPRPMMAYDGRIIFDDRNNDGVADVATAIERRWWANPDEEVEFDQEPAPVNGPEWASRQLTRRFGIPLGRIQRRTVMIWQRDPASHRFTLARVAPDRRWH